MKNSFLSSFTPSLMSSETLEAIFVHRHKLAQDLVELICDSSVGKSKHFRLVVGMRGIGKTHTIALIYHRLKANEDLQDKLLIAWLKEEEWGVSSWLDLLMRIFQALEIECPAEYQAKIQDKIESLYEMSSDDAMRQGEIILQEFVGSKTLLLLAENLDEIFNGLKDIGQKQFRAYIQNHNFITIVATSQSLFTGVAKKDAAFYGFFATEYLDKLTIEDATKLLTKIAQLQEDSELESFIQSSTGRDRIKAIHHLAGGNHRVYIIFSQFLTRNSLDELVKPVMQTLDELTPYYQARMQWLSPQQRKIIEFLCDRRNAVSVKEIAHYCFITHQTASGQLKDLRAKGYVTAESLGRSSFYELQEPLMRICLEVKKQRGEPIKLFIDFLRIWYTKEELKQRLETLPEKCLEREYINHALAFTAESKILISFPNDSNNSNSLFYQGILEEKKGNDTIALKLFNKAIENEPNNNYILLHLGNILFKLGNYKEAILSYQKILEINPSDNDAWNNLGINLFALGNYKEAILSYQKALAINPDSYKCWYNYGITLFRMGRYKETVSSYKKALYINPNDHDIWNNLGIVLFFLEQYEEAILSYQKALDINPNSHKAWYNYGIALRNLGRYEKAIKSYEKALEINPDDDDAWYNRGVALSTLERYEEAVISYNKALEINPNDNIAWRFNGIALFNLERYEESVVSYDKALEININDDLAWNYRGIALRNLGRYEEAVASYNKALEINPHDNIFYSNIGKVLQCLGRYDEALESYNKAISIINSKGTDSYFSHIEVLFKLNRWNTGFTNLDESLDHLANFDKSYKGNIKEYIKIIMESTTDIVFWRFRLQTLVEIYNKYQLVSLLSKGIIDNIPNLMSEIISNKAAQSWLEIWQEIAGDKPELQIALRFLKTAVEYKENPGDRKVLLQLAKEERSLLESLLQPTFISPTDEAYPKSNSNPNEHGKVKPESLPEDEKKVKLQSK